MPQWDVVNTPKKSELRMKDDNWRRKLSIEKCILRRIVYHHCLNSTSPQGLSSHSTSNSELILVM